jgi:hypothetical protein
MYSTLYPFDTISPRTCTNEDSFFLLRPRSQIISFLFFLDRFADTILPVVEEITKPAAVSFSPLALLDVALVISAPEDLPCVASVAIEEDIK